MLRQKTCSSPRAAPATSCRIPSAVATDVPIPARPRATPAHSPYTSRAPPPLMGRKLHSSLSFRPINTALLWINRDGIGRPRRGGAFRQRACKPDPVANDIYLAGAKP